MSMPSAHRPKTGPTIESPVMAAVASLFEELLDKGPVAPDDSFLELGGNSLLAVQLMVRVREIFDIQVRVAEFFQTPTVRGLEELLVTHFIIMSSHAEAPADAT
jgi:acyl carrier protein